MRKDIINIVNELAAHGTLDFNCIECYQIILDFCKASGTKPNNNKYNVLNGMLQINGANVRRVDRLPKKVQFDEIADYYENKILARQEAIEIYM